MFHPDDIRPSFHTNSRESLEGSHSGNYSEFSTSSECLTASLDGTPVQTSGGLLAAPPSHVYHKKCALEHNPVYSVHYLGISQDVNLGLYVTRETDLQLIDKIEESQLEGKIKLVANEDDTCCLTVTKRGITVTKPQNKEVLHRHPLHSIAQVVHYEDSFGGFNIALKIGQVSRKVYDCYLFRCANEDEAQSICADVKKVFDSIIYTNSK